MKHRLKNAVGTKDLFGATHVLTKVAPKFLSKCLGLCLVGPEAQEALKKEGISGGDI